MTSSLFFFLLLMATEPHLKLPPWTVDRLRLLFRKQNTLTLFFCLPQLHTDKKQISVGFIGYPNVGKSSVINTLRSKKVCNVAPLAGETKVRFKCHLNLANTLYTTNYESELWRFTYIGLRLHYMQRKGQEYKLWKEKIRTVVPKWEEGKEERSFDSVGRWREVKTCMFLFLTW